MEQQKTGISAPRNVREIPGMIWQTAEIDVWVNPDYKNGKDVYYAEGGKVTLSHAALLRVKIAGQMDIQTERVDDGSNPKIINPTRKELGGDNHDCYYDTKHT